MVFSKKFPKDVPGSNYPIWEEVKLTDEEEHQVETNSARINYQLFDDALQDAKQLAIKHGLNTDENRVRIAVALFEKQASHVIFWKENKAKEKFDTK